ncbi:MAG TPA: hypothetical protein ENK51_05895 [Gammaproteobacteria bacterium]|nr:hypothetical protein [Gammaproteobacteria bacterium]
MIRAAATFLICILVSAQATAMGNYPEANACPPDKPYYAICTHSLHNLEGWFGPHCHTTRAEAEKDIEAHAREYHQGNTRWTGVAKTR